MGTYDEDEAQTQRNVVDVENGSAMMQDEMG
jgi:hypothetical protein